LKYTLGDGKKQILVSTFYQSVELINRDGFKPWGWPLSFEDSSFQGSPILYDIDGDGKNDIGIVDKNANLYWVRVGDFGQYLEDYHTQVPKLKIKKDWSKNLDPKFGDNYAMTSMFDHKNDGQYHAGWRYGDKSQENAGSKLFTSAAGAAAKTSSGKIKPDDLGVKSAKPQESYPELMKRQGDKAKKVAPEAAASAEGGVDAGVEAPDSQGHSRRRLLAEVVAEPPKQAEEAAAVAKAAEVKADDAAKDAAKKDDPHDQLQAGHDPAPAKDASHGSPAAPPKTDQNGDSTAPKSDAASVEPPKAAETEAEPPKKEAEETKAEKEAETADKAAPEVERPKAGPPKDEEAVHHVEEHAAAAGEKPVAAEPAGAGAVSEGEGEGEGEEKGLDTEGTHNADADTGSEAGNESAGSGEINSFDRFGDSGSGDFQYGMDDYVPRLAGRQTDRQTDRLRERSIHTTL
jgi:hypothetical protein